MTNGGISRKAIWVTAKSAPVLAKWFKEHSRFEHDARDYIGMIVVISSEEGRVAQGWFPHSVDSFHEHFKWLEIHENDFAPVELAKPFYIVVAKTGEAKANGSDD